MLDNAAPRGIGMQDRRADTKSPRGTLGRRALRRVTRCVALVVLSVPLVGVAGAQAVNVAPVLELSGSLTEWISPTSLPFTPWGYKIAVYGEAPCPLPDESECPTRKELPEYFEVSASPGERQVFTVYSQNIPFITPVEGHVWIGVGALLSQNTNPPAYSKEIQVPVVYEGAEGEPAPSRLWTTDDTVQWEAKSLGGKAVDAQAWGYKVGISPISQVDVSDIPGCKKENCRGTKYVEVAKSGEGIQSFSPCLEQVEQLGVEPVNGRVFVGVGTLSEPGGVPVSYTGSEVPLSLPHCPIPVKPNPTEPPPTEPPPTEPKHLAPPPGPVNSQAPSVAGTAAVGYLLTASPGGWQNPPNSYTFQWQICDPAVTSCQNISGATGATFPLTGGDFGYRLRVVVTAENGGGSATAVSLPSPVIGSTVESEVEWSFGWGRSFTVVESLSLHAVTAGAHVEVLCRGARCPFKVADVTPVAHSSNCRAHRCGPHGNATGSEALLGRLFKGRHLQPGTVIMVRVIKPGWVGRLYVFTVRANTRPSHPRPTCLAPDSTQESACVGGS